MLLAQFLRAGGGKGDYALADGFVRTQIIVKTTGGGDILLGSGLLEIELCGMSIGIFQILVSRQQETCPLGHGRPTETL